MDDFRGIPLDKVRVRRRVRRDSGDLTALVSAACARYGQISPIVVTEDFELIARRRRLEAARLLRLGHDRRARRRAAVGGRANGARARGERPAPRAHDRRNGRRLLAAGAEAQPGTGGAAAPAARRPVPAAQPPAPAPLPDAVLRVQTRGSPSGRRPAASPTGCWPDPAFPAFPRASPRSGGSTRPRRLEALLGRARRHRRGGGQERRPHVPLLDRRGRPRRQRAAATGAAKAPAAPPGTRRATTRHCRRPVPARGADPAAWPPGRAGSGARPAPALRAGRSGPAGRPR